MVFERRPVAASLETEVGTYAIGSRLPTMAIFQPSPTSQIGPAEPEGVPPGTRIRAHSLLFQVPPRCRHARKTEGGPG